MSELENIENVEDLETITTDNTTEELQENVEETTEVIEVEDNSAEIEAEQERLRREQEERERAEEEARLKAEEEAREQARIEHENFLKSFPDTTVFYRDLLENKDGSKSLGMPMNVWQADKYGCLDKHYDLSELTYVGTESCGIYYLKGHEKPESTIEELKVKKLAEISAEAHKYSQYECEEMYLTSSKGFRINADHKSQDNLKGLIGIGLTCKFKDYDNEFHPGITVEDLNVMLHECYANGAMLYQQKFEYEAMVANAKSREELYFDVVFDMADFSQS